MTQRDFNNKKNSDVNPLENLKLLRKDMEVKGWSICSFIFKYKSNEYIVLVKRFVDKVKRRERYALVQLHFLQSGNLEHELICEANSTNLFIDARTLREYFGIEYSENLGDILKQFKEFFGERIPTVVPENITDEQKTCMVTSLSNSDAEDPNKIYCTNVKRNPDGKQRTIFNSNKTKLLRKQLYEYYENDRTISFCYLADPNAEKSDETIIKNSSINNPK